jgi:ABC-type phosphate transport system substrate-binding protein
LNEGIMNRRTLLIGILAIALPAALSAGAKVAAADAPDIVVVVHKSNGVAPMNRSQLAAIFKAKSTQFPGGGRADPVNLAPDDPARQDFDLAVLGMRPDEVERFWLDSKIRSGVGSPRKLSGPDAVIRFVAGDESGIGYVEAADANDSVRVVARVRGGQVVAP